MSYFDAENEIRKLFLDNFKEEGQKIIYFYYGDLGTEDEAVKINKDFSINVIFEDCLQKTKFNSKYVIENNLLFSVLIIYSKDKEEYLKKIVDHIDKFLYTRFGRNLTFLRQYPEVYDGVMEKPISRNAFTCEYSIVYFYEQKSGKEGSPFNLTDINYKSEECKNKIATEGQI